MSNVKPKVRLIVQGFSRVRTVNLMTTHLHTIPKALCFEIVLAVATVERNWDYS